MERQGNNGQAVAGSVPLAEDFFDPTILNGEGQASTTDPMTGLTTTDIGPILKGDASGDAQADDLQAVNEIRDLLFGNGGLQDNGQDLIARDVERARVDGIGSYNQVRSRPGFDSR